MRDTADTPARDPDETPGYAKPDPPDCDEFFDVDRDPLDGADRWDMMRLQQEWRDHMGRQLDVADELQRRRAMCVLAHFPRDEIMDALETARKCADRPSWSYFRAVLQSTDDADDYGDDAAMTDKYSHLVGGET